MKLEEELIGMHNWAEQSISLNSSSCASMASHPIINQAIFPNFFLPTHSTSIMSNYLYAPQHRAHAFRLIYPTLQTQNLISQNQTPLLYQ